MAVETGAGCVNLDGKLPDWLKKACQAASFAGATPVLLADGRTKPIREVKVGDRVIAADPITGKRGAREVTAKHVGIGKRLLVAIALAGAVSTPVVATAEHAVWRASTGEWVAAGELRAGDELREADGDVATVATVRAYAEDVPVYSLTVAGLATYHVGAGGDAVLVHNARCGPVTGDDLKRMRDEFERLKPDHWKREAATHPDRYTPDQLDDMKSGKAPLGSDGYPMEVHHMLELSFGGTNDFDNMMFMTRTDHRGKGNKKRNHPNLYP